MVVYSLQHSFLERFNADEKNSENFFKVLHEHMQEAQNEIKANIIVNTGDPLIGASSDLRDGKGLKDSLISGNVTSLSLTNSILLCTYHGVK